MISEHFYLKTCQICKVGVPAKSGISGVTMVVIPNVMGIALWSPHLDKLKNSVRGTMFCKEFLNTYSFHRFEKRELRELSCS